MPSWIWNRCSNLPGRNKRRTQIATPNILAMRKWAAAVAVVVLKVAVIAGPVQAASAIGGRVVMDRADLAQAAVVPVIADPDPADRAPKAGVPRARAVFVVMTVGAEAEEVFDARMIVPRRHRCRRSKFHLSRRKKASNPSRAKSN